MVRLTDVDEGMRDFLVHFPCPKIALTAFSSPPLLTESRVALVSSAGLRRRSDTPFSDYAIDYRVLPNDAREEIIQDHMNASHDRTGYLQDLNTIFPVDRLDEMAAAREIGSVASYHYSFMGATYPTALESNARRLARIMLKDEVDVVVLCPV